MRTFLFSLIMIITIFTLPTANARSAANGSFGLLLGAILPSGSNAAIATGVTLHYKFWGQRWRAGAFFRRYGVRLRTQASDTEVSASTTDNAFGGELVYFFDSSLEGFNAGVRTGISAVGITAQVIESGTTTVDIDNKTSSLFFGPRIGYDHPIGRFSIGAELSYTFSLGNSGANSADLLIPFRYWF